RRTFQAADRAQFAHARAQKMQQVSFALCLSEEPVSDQRAIWDAIAAKLAHMGVASSTGAMSAIFEDRREDVQDYVGACRAVDRQIGAAYAIGGAVSGIEVFASPATFEKLARKVLASYALDAMEFSGSADPPTADAVRTFIDAAKAAPSERFRAPGIGET